MGLEELVGEIQKGQTLHKDLAKLHNPVTAEDKTIETVTVEDKTVTFATVLSYATYTAEVMAEVNSKVVDHAKSLEEIAQEWDATKQFTNGLQVTKGKFFDLFKPHECGAGFSVDEAWREMGPEVQDQTSAPDATAEVGMTPEATMAQLIHNFKARWPGK